MKPDKARWSYRRDVGTDGNKFSKQFKVKRADHNDVSTSLTPGNRAQIPEFKIAGQRQPTDMCLSEQKVIRMPCKKGAGGTLSPIQTLKPVHRLSEIDQGKIKQNKLKLIV